MPVLVILADRAPERAGDRELLTRVLRRRLGGGELVQVCARCGGGHGHPRVAGVTGWVSLSRAGGTVAIAVSDDGPVGVDIESIAAVNRAPLDLLAPGETGETRDAAELWTAKEAILKLDGRGLEVDPREVTVRPRMAWAGASFDLRRMDLHALRPGNGLVGTLAALDATVITIEDQRSGGSAST